MQDWIYIIIFIYKIQNKYKRQHIILLSIEFNQFIFFPRWFLFLWKLGRWAVRSKIVKEKKTLTIEKQQMIKLEIKFTISFSTSDMPLIDCYWQFCSWCLVFLSLPLSPVLSQSFTLHITHRATYLYHWERINHFFPMLLRYTIFITGYSKEEKKNLRISPSAVFLLWNQSIPVFLILFSRLLSLEQPTVQPGW